jgi:hypothetical protein
MNLFEKFQTLMAAAAFAEENEHGTAREIASEVLTTTAKTGGGCAPIGTLAMDPGK